MQTCFVSMYTKFELNLLWTEISSTREDQLLKLKGFCVSPAFPFPTYSAIIAPFFSIALIRPN